MDGGDDGGRLRFRWNKPSLSLFSWLREREREARGERREDTEERIGFAPVRERGGKREIFFLLSRVVVCEREIEGNG